MNKPKNRYCLPMTLWSMENMYRRQKPISAFATSCTSAYATAAVWDSAIAYPPTPLVEADEPLRAAAPGLGQCSLIQRW